MITAEEKADLVERLVNARTKLQRLYADVGKYTSRFFEHVEDDPSVEAVGYDMLKEDYARYRDRIIEAKSEYEELQKQVQESGGI